MIQKFFLRHHHIIDRHKRKTQSERFSGFRIDRRWPRTPFTTAQYIRRDNKLFIGIKL